MDRVISGRAFVRRDAEGSLLVSPEPLSFWGGYDSATGEIIDHRSPLAGQVATGRVLVVPSTRGSSTTTAVLLEAIRAGTAPAALLTRGVDTFLTLACVVADELYDRSIPVVALEDDDFSRLASGLTATVAADGTVRVREGG